MPNSMHLHKSQILHLAPFLNAVVVYFVFVQDPHGELWTTLLKCAPIVCLMLYVLLKGFRFTASYKTSQRILAGLIFSCAGDALLNIDLFPHGMGAFALAQICYISAFGWKPLKLPIGIPLYIAGSALVAYVFNRLDVILRIGLPVYVTLLLTMCWRSVSRSAENKSTVSILCAIGSIAFVISDALIGIDMFFLPVPHARIWIMSTYYFAQFAIALSTYEEVPMLKATPKRSKPSVQNRLNSNDNVRRRAKPSD